MSGTAINKFIALMNKYGASKEPFMFIIDFDLKKPEIYKLNSIPQGIKFCTPIMSNSHSGQIYNKPFSFKKHPVAFKEYLKAFKNVQDNISLGNSYLLNLTFLTPIETDLTLEDIFLLSVAKYKLLYHNHFVVFSPEIFVRIINGVITSFPMKGTIDANMEGAEHIIMHDEKEMAEHNTIVDLIRNDLSIFADEVKVNRYRYLDEIVTNETNILQVSSEISGRLKEGYEYRLGDIFTGLLPAGSVTGAPKKETVRIIRESETYERGWYTGVFGAYDGRTLDSAVMIRYIEKDSNGLYFKSGGGITYMSDPVKEYEELISKVYVPVG